MTDDPVRAEAERSLAMATALINGDDASFAKLADEALADDPAQALYSMTWLLRLSLKALVAVRDEGNGEELLQVVALALANAFESH